MIEKFRDAVLKKIEDAKAETLLSLVQLKCASMQETGEYHVMLKSKYEGMEAARILVEETYEDMTAPADKPEDKPEQGPYA